MPLIDNDDREAFKKQLQDKSEKEKASLKILEQILPDIAADLTAAVKSTFHTHGMVRFCTTSVLVGGAITHISEAKRSEFLHTALAKEFELPISAFTIRTRVDSDSPIYFYVDVTFTPPLS